MLDVKAKIHRIRFGLGFRSWPRWAAYTAAPDSLAGERGLAASSPKP